MALGMCVVCHKSSVDLTMNPETGSGICVECRSAIAEERQKIRNARGGS